MVVEDDVLLALDLVDSLQKAGLEVTGPFSSVEVALQDLTRHRPHLAILDIDLNGQMSFPVADALAKENVPFLWLSASSPDVLPEHHRARPFVSKPFAPQGILQLVSHLLQTS
jgi:DNA-binding response OmpR family regulator